MNDLLQMRQGQLPGGILRFARQHPDDSRLALAKFHALAPLPDEAQRVIDEAVIQEGNNRLGISSRLITDLGLTYSLPGWLGSPELYWEKEAKRGHAQRTMTPGSEGERSMPELSGQRIPVYATQQHFSASIRYILTAERAGQPFDTGSLRQSLRRVREAIEDACINAAGVTIAGNATPGLLDESNVNTFTYVDSEAWDAAGHSGADIETDIIAAINSLKTDDFYGPYEVFIPTDYELELDKLYTDGTTTQPTSVRNRILSMNSIQAITTADQLPDDRVIVMQATTDVFDVIMGQEPSVLSWESANGMERFWLVLACMVPRVKATYAGNSGITVGNTS